MSERISVFPAKIKWDQITPWWRIFRLTRDCMLRPSLLCCLQFGQRLKLAFISAAAAACPNGSFFEPDIRNLPLLLCTIKQFLVGWAQGSQKEENGGNGVCRHNSIQSNRTAIYVHFWKEKGTDERKIGTHCGIFVDIFKILRIILLLQQLRQ